MIQVMKVCVCFYFPGRLRATGLVLRQRKQLIMFTVLSGLLTKVKTAITIDSFSVVFSALRLADSKEKNVKGLRSHEGY